MTHGEPRRRLILFTRYPLAGKTKTRLIPALGSRGAADLQRRMTEHTLCMANALKDREGVSLEIRFDGGTEPEIRTWLGFDLSVFPQGEGDLGERMSRAFVGAFAAGFNRVVLVGTDCPEMKKEHLCAAFSELETRDLVLGPAKDGGYYLIAMKGMFPGIFQGVSWGTDQVLRQTLACAESMNLSIGLLEVLQDVDRPEDLHVWERVVQGR